MAENQSTAAPQIGAPAPVQRTKSARSRAPKKQAPKPGRTFGCSERVHDFVNQYLNKCNTAPDAALLLLDERLALKTVEVVPTIPFLLRAEGRWYNVYAYEKQRYLKDLRKCALAHDAAAIVLAVRIAPPPSPTGDSRGIDDDANLREELQSFADDLFELLRRVDVELLDVVTWQRGAEHWKYKGRDIQSLHWLDWRAPGDPGRRSKDDLVFRRDGTLVKR